MEDLRPDDPARRLAILRGSLASDTVTGQTLELRVGEIIGVDWETVYLGALAELSRSSTASES